MRVLFFNTRTLSLPVIAMTLSLSLFLSDTPETAAQTTAPQPATNPQTPTNPDGTPAPQPQTATPEMQDAFEKGVAFFNENKYPEAMEQFEILLKAGVQDRNLFGLVGLTLYNLERYAEAIPFYNLLITSFPNERAPFLYERGRCYFELKEYDLALDSLSKAIIAGSRAANLHLFYHQRGEVYLEQGEFANALADFTIAVTDQPTNSEYHYSRGLAQMRFGAESAQAFDSEESVRHYMSAIASFDQALSIQADYPDALYQRGLASFQVGLIDDAITDIEQALKLEPNNPTYGQQFGFALLQQASQAASADPDDKATILDLYQNAIVTISRTIALPPQEGEEFDPLPLFIGRAEAFLNMSEHLPEDQKDTAYQQAIADCDFTLSNDPLQPSAFYFKGLAYRLMGETENALDAFSQTLEIAPTHPTARLRRGIIWYHLGEYDLAMDDFLEPADSTDPRPKFWAGLVNAKRGDYSRAVEAYTGSLQGNPRFALAFTNRGMAYFHLGLYQRAINDFNQTIRIDRRDAVAYYRRGVVQIHVDRHEEAMRSFEQAVRWNPDLAEAHQALGNLYLQMGKSDSAQEHLEKAKQLRS